MRVGILGPLTVSDAGRELDVGTGRQRALFLLLVLHANELVSPDRLIDELWGEAAPPSAPKVLQGHVSRLRHALPANAIVTHGSSYRLQGVDTDAAELERLLADARTQPPRRATLTLRLATELSRGRPLADVDYAPWAQPEIARLEELQLVAIEERLDAELQLGEAARIVPELEALVAAHPLRERPRSQLMLALYRSGRQAEALEAYAATRRRLVDELGIEPGPELQQLHRRILAQDAELGQVPHPLAAVARRTPWIAAVAGAAVVGAIFAGVLLARGGHASRPIAIPRDSVAVVDPARGRAVGRLALGGIPGTLALGDGSLWVVDGVDRTISQYGTRSLKRIRTIGLESAPYQIAAAPGELWLGNAFDGTVSRLDLATGVLSPPFRPEPSAVGRLALLRAFGSLWVGAQDNILSRLDPSTNRVQALIRAIHAPIGLAAVGSSVWAIEASRPEVVEVNARTNRIVRRVVIGGRPLAVASADGKPWVLTTAPPRVWRIDAVGGAPIVVAADSSDLAAGLGRLWVVSAERGTLTEIDPQRGAVIRTTAIAQPLGNLVAGAGRVWIAVP